MLYESREAVIKLFNYYSSSVSEAKYKLIHGEGLKKLTPKQMIQRLTITLAQVKGGNTSEILLNEIRQIIYSLYRANIYVFHDTVDDAMEEVQEVCY